MAKSKANLKVIGSGTHQRNAQYTLTKSLRKVREKGARSAVVFVQYGDLTYDIWTTSDDRHRTAGILADMVQTTLQGE